MRYLLLFVIILCSCFISESQTLDRNSNYWSFDDNSFNGNNTPASPFLWQSVQSPTTAQISGIFFIDSLIGWASHNGNGSMRTTDGGFNWVLSSYNDTNFTTGYNGVWFVDHNTGWCVGGAIQIRKTTNGGMTWFKQYGPPVAGIIHTIQFIDQNTGYIAGSKNFPYVPFAAKTTNGGANWNELSVSFSGAQELNKEFWFDANTGWIAGYNVLLKTTNGGTSFTNYFANVPPTGNGFNDLLCICFANQQTGWIGGSNLDKKNIYITTNGGVNWIFQSNPVSINNFYVQINDIIFMSPDSGWAIHGTPATGAIMATTNGGTNWTIEEGSNNWFQCVEYYQRQKAWCGADGGRVWYTNLSQITGIETNEELPKNFFLSQNYPNPFNPVTDIYYSLPKQASVKITIYNSIGSETSVLVNGMQSAGKHRTEFNGSNFSSGVYFYKIETPEFTETKKMILIK